jgi:hypothetical protein
MLLERMMSVATAAPREESLTGVYASRELLAETLNKFPLINASKIRTPLAEDSWQKFAGRAPAASFSHKKAQRV